MRQKIRQKIRQKMRAGLAVLIAGALAACSEGSEGGGPASATAGGDPARGRQVYLLNCTACHNTDPALDGTLGPAVAGASRALLEARILHGNYPPGYTPKRPGAQMPVLPHLAPAIPDLAAFLALEQQPGGRE